MDHPSFLENPLNSPARNPIDKYPGTVTTRFSDPVEPMFFRGLLLQDPAL